MVVIPNLGFQCLIKVMKNHLILAIFIPILFLQQCEPVVPQKSIVKKQLIFDNYEYEDIVGNVILGPIVNEQIDVLSNPVINLNESEVLGLNFDLLTDQFENLSLKIVHCNKNWKRSQLRDMEFMTAINDFRITSFDYSVNTIQPYISYNVEVPKPFLSGNYILAVYRRANPDDLLFTRKFIVYEAIASINQLIRVSTTINKREENQQIEFSLNYRDLLVNAPTKDISPIILQNHNWYSVVDDLTPTAIRANEGYIEYQPLNLEMNFPGWNEFRFMDLRTLSIAGRNVSNIKTSETAIQALLGLDKSREGLPYTQNFQDINGRYIIQNNDPGEGALNADYAVAQFNLKSDEIDGKVYITGRFNNWRTNESNLLRYDPSSNRYTSRLKLKQGYYEYRYAVESTSRPDFLLEGSHFLTENEYEIIVYYRRPGNINDEIIGYQKFNSIQN